MPDTTNARRQARYRAQRAREGLAQVVVYVSPADAPALRLYAKWLQQRRAAQSRGE